MFSCFLLKTFIKDILISYFDKYIGNEWKVLCGHGEFSERNLSAAIA